MAEGKTQHTDNSKVSHERDVAMRLFPYGTPLRTQKMLSAEKILREEYPGYSELVKALEAAADALHRAGFWGDEIRLRAALTRRRNDGKV